MGSQILFDGSRVPKPKADWILRDQFQAALVLIRVRLCRLLVMGDIF